MSSHALILSLIRQSGVMGTHISMAFTQTAKTLLERWQVPVSRWWCEGICASGRCLWRWEIRQCLDLVGMDFRMGEVLS